MEYFELSRKYVEERYGSDADDQTEDVLARWEDTLNRLENDPMSLAGELDWVAKRELMEGYRRRDGLDWDAARLQLVDLQYADVRADKGLYNRLVARGRIKRLLDEDTVERARTTPPEDTRAYFRGRCLEQYADDVAAASWDSVIFDLPPGPRSSASQPWNRFAERVITSRSSWTAVCTAEDLVRVLSGG
ncbi:proteasome accessory factor PafA2 family protein [Streptomyces sp. L7]